jgi:uncharacterized protein (TIGR02284 family)
MDSSKVVGVLNDLIETSKDGEYGFTTCAERATSVELKQTFLRRASDCAGGVRELQALVVQHGGKAEDGGTVAGAVRRGWVTVKDALSGHKDQAVLDECERAEDVALSRYRKALKQDDLPATVRQVVERQMAGVQANHDQIKALRDGLRARS